MRLAALVPLLLCACQPKFKMVEAEPEKRPPLEKQSAPPQTFPDPAQRPRRDNFHTPLDWRALRGLNVKTGELTPALRKLEGGAVQIKGYMVPFDDEYQNVTEFLLVPQAGMCVHVPAPPMNQIVLVETTAGAARVSWSKPVTVSGILEIAQADSPYGKVAFRMNATLVELPEDPMGYR